MWNFYRHTLARKPKLITTAEYNEEPVEILGRVGAP